jgi:hypothetical protein
MAYATHSIHGCVDVRSRYEGIDLGRHGGHFRRSDTPRNGNRLASGAPKGNDYERARAWMTADANAAIQGAAEGGATEIRVADAHDGMLNLLWTSSIRVPS